jgi:predicted transcriptional regulator
MPRKKSPLLTDAELRLMEVLWAKGQATVSEVVEGLPKDVDLSRNGATEPVAAGRPADSGREKGRSSPAPLAYSTVLTTLRILENKGYLRHVKDGRAFVYRPLVERTAAQESAVAHLVRRFFADSPELLVLNLIENKKISAKELALLRKRIADESRAAGESNAEDV